MGDSQGERAGQLEIMFLGNFRTTQIWISLKSGKQFAKEKTIMSSSYNERESSSRKTLLTENVTPQEFRDFLKCKLLPGRLSAGEAGAVLGFTGAEISILAHRKLLAPLGEPAANGPKWYSSAEVLEKCQERSWLDKATRIITSYWRDKNRRKSRDVAVR